MHKAKACVINCIDFRIQKYVFKYLSENDYIGQSDFLMVAGAGRDLTSPMKPEYGEYLWRQLDISVSLHHIDEILVIEHQDCGAYALDGLIPGNLEVAMDKPMHQEIAKKTLAKINEKYPNINVKFLYVTLDGSVENLF